MIRTKVCAGSNHGVASAPPGVAQAAVRRSFPKPPTGLKSASESSCERQITPSAERASANNGPDAYVARVRLLAAQDPVGPGYRAHQAHRFQMTAHAQSTGTMRPPQTYRIKIHRHIMCTTRRPASEGGGLDGGGMAHSQSRGYCIPEILTEQSRIVDMGILNSGPLASGSSRRSVGRLQHRRH